LAPEVAAEHKSVQNVSAGGAFPIGRCEPGQALHQCSAYESIVPTFQLHDAIEKKCKDDTGVVMTCFNASEAHRVCTGESRVWSNATLECLACGRSPCHHGEYLSGCGLNGQPGVCKPCTNFVPANASYSGHGNDDEPTSCPLTCSKNFPWLKLHEEANALPECRGTPESHALNGGCPIAHCFFKGPGGFIAFMVAAWILYFFGLGLLHCDAQHWYKLVRLVHKAALKREQKENEQKTAAVNEQKDDGHATL